MRRCLGGLAEAGPLGRARELALPCRDAKPKESEGSGEAPRIVANLLTSRILERRAEPLIVANHGDVGLDGRP
jgi:hypothetical protein